MRFLSDLSQNAYKAITRFPVALCWAAIGSFFLIGIYGTDDYKIIGQYDNLSMVLILGVSWLIATQFVSEALEHKLLYRILLKVGIFGGLVGFFFYLEQPEINGSDLGAGKWALLILAGHIFVIFAPFLEIWNKNRFWNFLKEINIALLRSGIYMLVLFLGLVLAVAALEFLFDVDLNDYIYLQIFIFCLGVVNTFIFLSDFPLAKKLDNSIDFNKTIEVLVKYILIPLSLLYLVIVYVYALKILFTWELPRGWVTYLISALSLLAFVIHIAIEPVRQHHGTLFIKRFFPFYFYAILPLIPLLFIALYKRISDYNFTELRYLGIVLAFWITGMLIYMLISKNKRLSLYAKSMFILILLSTFGPLSAFKISINAQLDELEELVEILENKQELVFSSVEYERFQSIIKYLDHRNALDKTEAYFGFNPDVAFSETGSSNMPFKIVDSLNIEVEKKTDRDNIFKTKRFKQNTLENSFAEEITDYTHFIELKLDKNLNEEKAIQLYANNLNEVSIRYYGEVLVETNITSHLETMAKKYDDLSRATQDEFTFRFKNKKGDFLIIFDELSYEYLPDLVNITDGKAKVFYRTYEALELP